MYGFEVYEYDACPYYNTSTKKKLAYGAVPDGHRPSMLRGFLAETRMKPTDRRKTLPAGAAANPTTQENLFSMRTYNLSPDKGRGSRRDREAHSKRKPA